MMDMEMNAELERQDDGSEAGGGSSEGSSAGSIYCSLEQDFAKIRSDMKSNRALAAYEPEYTRLFESLYKAYRLEEQLTEKCKSLQEDVTEMSNKITELNVKVKSQETNIEQLKSEILEGKQLADVAHVREQKAHEIIENLHISIDKLTEEINQKSKQLVLEDEAPPNKEQDDLAKDHERLLGEVDTLRQRLKSVLAFNQELETKLVEMEEQANDLQDNIEQQNSDMLKERREREKIESELQDVYEELKIRTADLQTAEESSKEAANNAIAQEKLLMEQVVENEKHQKEIQKLLQNEVSMKALTNKLEVSLVEVREELADKNKLIKDTKREMQRNKEELGKMKSEKDNAQSKLTKERNLNLRTEENLKRISAALKSAELEIAGLKRFIESEKKTMEKLNRDKVATSKALLDLEEINTHLNLEINVFEQNNRKLQAVLEKMEEGTIDLKRQIKNVENERDRYILESQELTQKVEDHADALKLKQLEISDFQNRLFEAEGKLRQQQTLFEDIRSERNSFKKNLLLAQDQLVELKAKVKSLNVQIDYLKEQLTIKEAEKMKQEFLFAKLDKEKETLKLEISNARNTISNLREEMDKMRQEEKLLRNFLQKADLNLSRQKKEMESLMNERDVIGTQIVRRNDEMSLQYNKIQILTETLARGEKQYTQRMEEIRVLKLELKNLRLRNAALEKNTSDLADLRSEVLHLEHNLNKEKLKVTALEEEVQNPLNIHRWRSLEGSDPDTFELLKKNQFLQKRIIKMASEMIAKEKQIKEMEKLYANVCETVAKQPGPEVLEHLNKTRRALRDRGNKMKSLVAELNMALSTEHKFELEKISKELKAMKVKYLAQRKKNVKPIELVRHNHSISGIDSMHFYGGGFNMSKTVSKASTVPTITTNK